MIKLTKEVKNARQIYRQLQDLDRKRAARVEFMRGVLEEYRDRPYPTKRNDHE
jgi:hypothetical protein